MLAQWRMLSIREVPTATISGESLSILLHTPIFKYLKATYYETKLGKLGCSPTVIFFFFQKIIKLTARVQNCVFHHFDPGQ